MQYFYIFLYWSLLKAGEETCPCARSGVVCRAVSVHQWHSGATTKNWDFFVVSGTYLVLYGGRKRRAEMLISQVWSGCLEVLLWIYSSCQKEIFNKQLPCTKPFWPRINWKEFKHQPWISVSPFAHISSLII